MCLRLIDTLLALDESLKISHLSIGVHCIQTGTRLMIKCNTIPQRNLCWYPYGQNETEIRETEGERIRFPVPRPVDLSKLTFCAYGILMVKH